VFREIEDRLGRDRSLPKFASRPIDLDILLYGDAVVDVPGIRIPRPEIVVNAFVLKPLQDIAPELPHPETGQSFAELWQRMQPVAPKLTRVELDL
jgi:2-amino-4-hydroxy-6-hydroxymethyldihydropteridine diphosphokinase